MRNKLDRCTLRTVSLPLNLLLLSGHGEFLSQTDITDCVFMGEAALEEMVHTHDTHMRALHTPPGKGVTDHSALRWVERRDTGTSQNAKWHKNNRYV